ncbi:MAG: orotidine 5'-phosphate decarboxylase / HUMPS family protein [Fervidicoccaceae archaeon]
MNLLKNPPYLQVAIDVIDLSRAVRIANAVAVNERVIIEVGTPLIKSSGITSVRVLSQIFENNIVFADMKTMDAGALEAEIAIGSGAKIMSVLGAADDNTIFEALTRARELGGDVQVDLISVPNVLERARGVNRIGIRIIGLHAGIDQQLGKKMRGIDFLHIIKELKESMSDIIISVAGGIRPEEAQKLVSAGADIIVAGSSIVKSSDPKEEARKFLKEMGI